MHSNPNNAGIESEPILDEENNKYIGYQAKFFDNAADYGQIKEFAEKAVKHYADLGLGYASSDFIKTMF